MIEGARPGAAKRDPTPGQQVLDNGVDLAVEVFGDDIDETYGGRYLARGVIERLSDEMTMGDTFRATREAPDDRQRMGVLAFWFAARRLDVIADDVDLESFLDRVRQDDFVEIVQGDRSAKSTPGQT